MKCLIKISISSFPSSLRKWLTLHGNGGTPSHQWIIIIMWYGEQRWYGSFVVADRLTSRLVARMSTYCWWLEISCYPCKYSMHFHSPPTDQNIDISILLKSDLQKWQTVDGSTRPWHKWTTSVWLQIIHVSCCYVIRRNTHRQR